MVNSAMNDKKEVKKPKGPMSAYACFVQVVREEHRRKHPEENLPFSELARKCGEKWKTLGPRERKRFEDMATCDRDRYLREMSNYIPEEQLMASPTKQPHQPPHPQAPQHQAQQQQSQQAQARGTKRKKVKDPNMPKRGWSAFFFYCNEFRPQVRAENPDWKVGDVAKELGKRWEQCPDKTKYEVMAVADRERYDKEMTAYRNGTFVKKSPLENASAVAAMTAAATAAAAGSSAVHEDDLDEEEEEEEEEEDDSASGPASSYPLSQSDS